MAPWRLSYLRKVKYGPQDSCLFCDHLSSEDDAKSHILHRGQQAFVVLNLYPYTNGHLMVVPNVHISDYEQLDAATIAEIGALTQQCVALLRTAYNPQGFNVGLNLGPAAGAGVPGHLHQHIVPRWSGDTNFMTAIGETRVIPEWVDDTYAELRGVWLKLYPK